MKRLGIRKETKNKWERRVPLNPVAVKELIEKGFEVVVQPSETRIYKNDEYENVGAIINDDLSNCDFVIGVKEITADDILPDIPHLFFSHTIKGQEYNMPLLKSVLDKKVTLLDYEKITDSKNRRLVFFGEYAGNAGMIDTLHGLGKRLYVEHGIKTPFLKIKHAYEYDSVQDAIEQIKQIGAEIRENGLPQEITPLNVFLMGYGHVSHGSRVVLEAFPFEEIEPEELLKQRENIKNNVIYISTFKEKHMVKRKDGNAFELMHYYQNPTQYESQMEEFLDQCSVYVNAIYWDSNSPVFVTREYLQKQQEEDQKLLIIGDITCDINGSVAATIKPTWPDNPVFIYDAFTSMGTDGYEGNGVAVMAVDNLPCEFPKEASDSFSSALMPFMESMLLNDYTKSIHDSSLPDPIKKACIAHQGKLQSEYNYLQNDLKKAGF